MVVITSLFSRVGKKKNLMVVDNVEKISDLFLPFASVVLTTRTCFVDSLTSFSFFHNNIYFTIPFGILLLL